MRRVAEVERGKKTVDSVEKSQLERWKATGVVALSESNLKVCRSSLEYKTRGILIYCCCCLEFGLVWLLSNLNQAFFLLLHLFGSHFF